MDHLAHCSLIWAAVHFVDTRCLTAVLCTPGLWNVAADERQFVANRCSRLATACDTLAGLAQNDYLKDKAFLNYLQYLEYWRQPQYAKYIRSVAGNDPGV